MKPQLLILDTETGGLDASKHALLSVGMVLWQQGELQAKEEIWIKADPARVTGRSLEINRINLDHHNKMAFSEKEGLDSIIQFLEAHFLDFPVIVCGHNVSLDVAFLKKLFQDNGVEFSKYLSHRVVDTASVLQFLGLQMGLDHASLVKFASSDYAFEYFKVPIEEKDRHTALGDALATGFLLNRLLEWKPFGND